MKKIFVYALLYCFMMVVSLKAQRIIYAKPNTDDRKIDNYSVIGNYNGNILVYKQLPDKSIVSVYNAYMNEISRNNLDIQPSKILKTDFIAYADFSYMVYQYLTENLLFCMAAKLDKEGKMVGKPLQLDYYPLTGSKNGLSSIVPYAILNSEDKKRIMVLKAGKVNDEKYVFKTLLFDENLNLVHNGKSQLPILNNNFFIDQFHLANDGGLVFLGVEKPNATTLTNKYFLEEKPPLSDNFKTDTISLGKTVFKDINLEVDNANNQYALTSFYYDDAQANIAGVFHFVWDKSTNHENSSLSIPLTSEVMVAAMGNKTTKSSSFNDFYLQNIILKKDGGFCIAAECIYSVTRISSGTSTPIDQPGTNNLDSRLGMNPSPILDGGKRFLPSTILNQTHAPADAYPIVPQQTINQMSANNVLVLSFDKNGKLQAQAVLRKNQFIDDSNGANVSYAMVNTGDGLRFIYNSFEKLNARIPTFQFVTVGGQTEAPKVFDFDKNVTWMPRYAKQTSLRQLVVPCISRSVLSFSKIDF